MKFHKPASQMTASEIMEALHTAKAESRQSLLDAMADILARRSKE